MHQDPVCNYYSNKWPVEPYCQKGLEVTRDKCVLNKIYCGYYKSHIKASAKSERAILHFIKYGQFSHRSKRYRATAVIINNGKVLLVRDRGKHDYSFPGGGFKKGESTIQASIREVREELVGLSIISAERLRNCDLEGKRAHHKVCRLVINGNPHIQQSYELDRVIWWNMKDKLPVQGHVKYILSKLTVNPIKEGR